MNKVRIEKHYGNENDDFDYIYSTDLFYNNILIISSDCCSDKIDEQIKGFIKCLEVNEISFEKEIIKFTDWCY